MGTESFSGIEGAAAWGWTPHPHLVTNILEKSRAIHLLNLSACVAYKKRENLSKDIKIIFFDYQEFPVSA